MSYVRWSSANFRSDVYSYRGSGGFWTHVAKQRFLWPLFPSPGFGRWGSTWCGSVLWLILHHLNRLSRRWSPMRPIGLPEDGKTFCDESEEAMFERLRQLKRLGYRVPARTFDLPPPPREGLSYHLELLVESLMENPLLCLFFGLFIAALVCFSEWAAERLLTLLTN